MSETSSENEEGSTGALSRSSIEAYTGILVAIVATVIPYWWAQAILLMVAVYIVVDLSFRVRTH